MVDIWRNRIEMFDAVRSGRLKSSVAGGLSRLNNLDAEFRFRFVEYGIHVENGVGNGYQKGNNGRLTFLDQGKRNGVNLRNLYGYNKRRRAGSAHNAYISSGEPRKRRPWFSPSWWYSRKVLANHMVKTIGDEFSGMFDNISEG